MANELPKGFVLNQPEQPPMPEGFVMNAPPPLPQGFVMNQSAPVAEPAPNLRFAPDDSTPNVMRIYDPATKLISPGGEDYIQDVKSLTSVPARVMVGGQKGVAGLGQAFQDIAYQHYSKDPATRRAEIEKYSAFPDLGDAPKEMFEEAQLIGEQIEKEDPLKTKAGQTVGGVAESIGQMAVPLAAGAVTGQPWVTVAGITGLTTGQVYGESRAKGLSIEDAWRSAVIQGGAEGTFEALSLGPLVKILRPGKFTKKAIEYFAKEVPGELATTAIQQSTGVYFDEPDPDKRAAQVREYLSSKEFAQDELDTLIATILQGGVMTAGARGLGKTVEKLAPAKPEITATPTDIAQEEIQSSTPEAVPQQAQQEMADVPLPQERFTVEAPDATADIGAQQQPQETANIPLPPEERFTVKEPEATPEAEMQGLLSPEQQQAVDVAVAKPARAEGALTESSKEVLSTMADDIEARPILRGKKGGNFSSMIEGLYQDYPFLESYKGTFKRSEIVRGIRNLISGRKLGKNQQVLADEALNFIQEDVLSKAHTLPTMAESDVQVGDSFTTVTPEGVLDDVTVIADDGVTKTLKDGVVYQVPSSGENVPVVGELKKPEPLPAQAPEVVPDAPQEAPQPTEDQAAQEAVRRSRANRGLPVDQQPDTVDESLTPAEREQQMLKGYRRGAEARAAKKETIGEKISKGYQNLIKDYLDQNQPMIRRVKAAARKLKKRGKKLEAKDNPMYAVEEAAYSASEMRTYLQDTQDQVKKPLEESGASTDDLALYLTARRVIEERGDISNPYGLTPETAAQQMEQLKSRVGDEQFAAIQQGANAYNRIRQSNIISKMEESEMFTPELIAKIKSNDAYATFSVVEFMEKQLNLPKEMLPSAEIFKQEGTKKDVADPFISTMLKDVALIRAMNKNQAIKESMTFMENNFAEETIPAEMKYDENLGYMVADTTNAPAENMDTVSYMEHGKIKTFWVDAEVAEMYQGDPARMNTATKILQVTNTVWRGVFIEYNPGFWITNAIRDYVRMSRNLPKMHKAPDLIGNLPTYVKALKDSFGDQFGIPVQDLKDMARKRMLISVESRRGLDNERTEIDRVLARFELDETKKTKYFDRIGEVFTTVSDVGQAFERASKLAAYRMLKKKGDMTDREIGHMVRTQAGSPDFMRRGRSYGTYNTVFLFANAIKEGIRADITAAKKRPAWTAANVAGVIMLPKALMIAAAIGLLGDDIEEIMNAVPEYDKTNYYIIPVGLTPSGKAIYMRIPMDESGRVIGGMFWKMFNPEEFDQATDLFGYMSGNIPSPTPTLTVAWDAFQYANGNNPYDYFRGRPSIPKRAFEAGGEERSREALKHFWNESPGSVLYRAPYDDLERVKESMTEEFLDLAIIGPFASRFLKVSDQGLRETYAAAGESEKRKKLTENIQLDRRIIEEVNKYTSNNELPPMGTAEKLYAELVADKTIDPHLTKIGQFKNRVKSKMGRAKNRAAIDALSSAVIGEQKNAIYKAIMDDLKPAEKTQFLTQGIIAGLITPDMLERGAYYDVKALKGE